MTLERFVQLCKNGHSQNVDSSYVRALNRNCKDHRIESCPSAILRNAYY